MERTSLGLTKVEPGESIFEDRASFTTRNIDLIDRLLRLGASTHKHTAKPAVANPGAPPTMAVDAGGGTIPADTPVFAGFTALDDRGGETLLSPVVDGVTPGGISDVPGPPTAVVDYTAGALPANTYYYVLTGTDLTGGETQAGSVATAVVNPGSLTARVQLDGLLTAVQAIGATAWRLYRSTNGGQLGLLGQGATETFTDDGQPCLDPQLQPPVDSTTGGTAALRITVPLAALPADATAFRLYVSTSLDFSGSNLLVGEYDLADADVEKQVQSLDLEAGYPPPISTSLDEPEAIGGADVLRNTITLGPELAIPAAGPVEVTLNQPLIGEKQRVEVGLWVDHDNINDLTITLIDPQLTEYPLTTGGGNGLDPALGLGVPGSIGVGPAACDLGFFNDQGDPAVGGGAIFTYQPNAVGYFIAESTYYYNEPIGAGTIGDDDGESAQGDWKVRFESNSGGVGTVHFVSLNFEPHRLPRDGHRITTFGSDLPPRSILDFGEGVTVEDDIPGGGVTRVRVGRKGTWGINANYDDPSAPKQNMQIDAVAGYGYMATAAAADMRVLGAAPPAISYTDQMFRVHFTGVADDDVVGSIIKALDIDNFLAVRLNNTVPALEIVSVDANVVTVIAALPLAAAITGSVWVTGEIESEDLGATLQIMHPSLSIATPLAAVGGKLDATQSAKYYQPWPILGVAGSWIIAGAANTARVIEGQGTTP